MNRSNEGRGPFKSSAGIGTPVPSHLLCKREVAATCGVSERTVDDWLAKKMIPRLHLSARLIRFDLAKVLAALARYEIKEVGAVR
jgi:predicted DNA-binding transcriptional regulator AlpA